MLSRALFAACVFFIATALAAADPVPYKLGVISLSSAFGLNKRQEGYHPQFHPCGSGATCEIACGSGSVQCTSNDARTHCFTPVNQTCCPNLSGHACADGYYCTQDSADQTWCCPNGMDLVTCAAQYSVSALVSLSGSATAAAESTPAVTTPAATEASGTVTAFTDLGTTPYAASTGTKGLNYTATASATIAAFTGAASKYNTYGVLSAVVLGLAGLIVGL